MTTFDEWLRGLGAAQKGPVTLPAASRGRVWNTSIALPGDWTGATLRGEIRLDPDASPALVAFTVSGPSVGGGESLFSLSLTDAQTSSLPSDSDGDGIEYFPFDLLLTPSGGDEELLFGGTFTLLGRITE